MHDVMLGSSHRHTAIPSTSETTPSDSVLDYEEGFQNPEHLSQFQIICLVVGMAGAQVAFSIQFVTGISYFRSLGINQSVSTSIWFIPPLCGTFIQPLFGRWSDACHRRKPFIIFGGLGLIVALLGYAWSPELAIALTGPQSAGIIVQVTALSFFLALNMSVQPVQAGLRALVVDHCHTSQQIEVNAWASRINHIASMITYLAAASAMGEKATTDDSQMHYLAALGSIVIVGSLSVTCYTVTESRKDGFRAKDKASGGILGTWKLLSPQLRQIYFAQFFSWFAWFPVIVQITSFMNEMSCSYAIASAEDTCTTAGASALFYQACVALVTSFLLPFLAHRISTAGGEFKDCSGSTQARWELQSLQMLWLASQVLFAALVSTTFYKSRIITMVAMALSGFCWCVTQWVPFVLVNAEVIQIEKDRRLSGLDSRTGVLVGAHNTFIAFPQILVTGVSSLLFEVLKAANVSNSLDDILWVFSISICMSLVAAYLLSRL